MQDKLMDIQQELKAPKGQYNDFGGFSYRSCEDILEAVKPLLKKNELTLRLNDELIYIGDRYYIKATAILSDGNATIENIAYAREEENKKGMDGSQITGASSSYARKYALNGLFLIDDVKDSDTTNKGEDKEPTLEDAKKYVINFGKKHPGEPLIDVYETDYGFIEWCLENRQNDTTLIKCINLLDAERVPLGQTDAGVPTGGTFDNDGRLELQVKFEKLILETSTAKEDIYDYYKVANNTEMSIAQLKDAIKILEEKKEKTNGK